MAGVVLFYQSHEVIEELLVSVGLLCFHLAAFFLRFAHVHLADDGAAESTQQSLDNLRCLFRCVQDVVI